jgi:hypothetical protein
LKNLEGVEASKEIRDRFANIELSPETRESLIENKATTRFPVMEFLSEIEKGDRVEGGEARESMKESMLLVHSSTLFCGWRYIACVWSQVKWKRSKRSAWHLLG